MADNKYYNPAEHRKKCWSKGLESKVSTHHCTVADLLHDFDKPTVLEFGTCHGLSTSLILKECEKQSGKMVSIDIDDRSDVASSKNWQFIKSDDVNIDYILEKAPFLADGVDLLHIDSLHTYEHVKKQLMTWYEYVKENGYITFHDVDAYACSPDGFKPSPSTYHDLAGVMKAVKEFFYANSDDIFLEIHYGATGMAIMKKLSPKGTKPNAPQPVKGYKIAPGITASFKLVLNAIKRFLCYNFGFLDKYRTKNNPYDEVDFNY